MGIDDIKKIVAKPFQPVLVFLAAAIAVILLTLSGASLLDLKVKNLVTDSYGSETFKIRVQQESRSVWAETITKATDLADRHNIQLVAHERRIEILEAQSSEVLRKLDVITVELQHVREDISDLKHKGK